MPRFITIVLLLVSISLKAQTEDRIALVIGVQNYTSIAPLRHSLNDANDIASVLKTKGFKVETVLDPKSKKEVKDAIARYFNLMNQRKGSVGVIYYAGHGTQHEGENYLIPASATLQLPGDLDEQCVRMNTVMSVMNSSDNLNILMMDACRTNALPAFSRDIAKGLASVEVPKGSIVVFATQPNTVASDGTGRNGLFTSKLLRYINEPNMNIGDILKKVKQDVNAESSGKQLPSVVDNSLGGDFFFTIGQPKNNVSGNQNPNSGTSGGKTPTSSGPDRNAVPPSGMAAFNNYLATNLKYPTQAIRNGIEGDVLIEFKVNTDGTITDVSVIKGLGSGCDEEAIRLLKASPPWTAARKGGNTVSQFMSLSVKFALE